MTSNLAFTAEPLPSRVVPRQRCATCGEPAEWRVTLVQPVARRGVLLCQAHADAACAAAPLTPGSLLDLPRAAA